jgi:hypothetical protein
VFASEVGRDSGVIQFLVSAGLIDDWREWSEPVRFRFEVRGDGLYDMVLQRAPGMDRE